MFCASKFGVSFLYLQIAYRFISFLRRITFRLYSVAEDCDAGGAAFGAGVEDEIIAAVLDGIDVIGLDCLYADDFIVMHLSGCIGEVHTITLAHIFELAEVRVKVVCGNNEIIGII